MSERRIKVMLPPISFDRWASVSASKLIESIQKSISAAPADFQGEVKCELSFDEFECWYYRPETSEEIAEREAKDMHAKRKRAETEIAELRRLKAKYPSE